MKTKSLVSTLSLIAAALTASLHGQALPNDAAVGGKTISEWTAEWWKWIWLQPTNNHPWLDPDGRWATNAQPEGPVFFVAGFVDAQGLTTRTRAFTISDDQYLLFGLANVAPNNIDTVPPLTVQELRDLGDSVIDAVSELRLTIDGVPVPGLFDHRVLSPVYSYELTNANNFNTIYYGHPITGVIDPEVSDGYWVLLQPLAPGTHVISWGSTFGPPFDFHQDVTNIITVVPNYVLPTNAVVGGKSIEEWTAEWFKWLYSSSTNRHPLFDPDGTRAHIAQPGGEVFFLAGVVGVPQTTQSVTRVFSIPEGKYLFFPLNNFFGDNVFTDPPLSVQELRDLLAGLVQNVSALHASIDGTPVPVDLFSHRAISPVFSFEFTSPDNMESYWVGQPFTGLNDPIVADGFYLMIRPLPLGEHVIRFGGANGPPFENGLDITARITVVPDYVLPTNAVVGGKTIEEWSAEWWKWVFSVPTNQNPLLVSDGSRAHDGQPGDEVFFLAGIYETSSAATRTFSVPEGKYLLVPIHNINGENIDTEPPLTVPELRDIVTAHESSVQQLHVRIDGVPVPADLFAHRAASPVFSFDFTSADNLKSLQYGHPITGLVDPMLSDGHWLLLKPLPRGPHVIQFGATGPSPKNFTFEVTANITLLPFPSFGSVTRESSGQMRLAVNGFYGKTYVFQASTNLVDWVPLSTNIATSGSLDFADTAAASFHHRFYRAVQVP